MSTQHTPGPWRVIIMSKSKATIVGADFPQMGYVADVNLCRNNMQQELDGLKNLTLIAAAPTLYEALRIMVDAANVDEIDPLVMFASIEKARAALDSARGDQ